MKCKYCNNELRVDDVDFNFKGNKDIYYICDNCDASAFEKIRYGKSIIEESWDSKFCPECGAVMDEDREELNEV